MDVAHIITVGDRPDDLEAALRFLASERMALIITSGRLGPTADDLTAEIVGRFVGRELVLDEEMEEEDRCDPAEVRTPLQLRPRGDAGSEPKAGFGPGRGDPDRPGGDGARPRGAGGRHRRGRAPRPAARAARSDRERSRPSRCAQCSLARTPMRPRPFTYSGSGVGARETLREIEKSTSRRWRSATCLRQAELVVDIRHPPEDEALSKIE